MRCFALAEELRQRGGSICFICRDSPGDFSSYLNQQGFKVHRLPALRKADASTGDPETRELSDADAIEVEAVLTTESALGAIDWLVVDHYGLDTGWQKRVRGQTKAVLVIDDNADKGGYQADVIVNPNVHADSLEYVAPSNIRLLMGPRYALLRAEFRGQPLQRRARRVPRIFVCIGAADLFGVTVQVIKTLEQLSAGFSATVVVGANTEGKFEIRERAAVTGDRIRVVEDPSSMADLMDECDLAICTPSTTLLECRARGLDCIVVKTANNQARVFSWVHDVSLQAMADQPIPPAWNPKSEVSRALSTLPHPVSEVASQAVQVDGEGARRIADVLYSVVEASTGLRTGADTCAS